MAARALPASPATWRVDSFPLVAPLALPGALIHTTVTTTTTAITNIAHNTTPPTPTTHNTTTITTRRCHRTPPLPSPLPSTTAHTTYTSTTTSITAPPNTTTSNPPIFHLHTWSLPRAPTTSHCQKYILIYGIFSSLFYAFRTFWAHPLCLGPPTFPPTGFLFKKSSLRGGKLSEFISRIHTLAYAYHRPQSVYATN